MVRSLVAGNWKMNGLKSAMIEIVNLSDGLDGTEKCSVMVCPPSLSTTLAVQTADKMGDKIAIGVQNCHSNTSGAFTGDVSAQMISDIGATAVIVGHSERRDSNTYNETDEQVKAKAVACHDEGLMAIICVGESEEQRKSGNALDIVSEQVKNSVPEGKGSTSDNTVIAYEPIWAIGTGLVPTVEDVAEMHTMIRNVLVEKLGEDEGANISILYGGSVKPDNAKELMSVDNVNGALVGGASLKASDFLGIIAAYK